MSSRPGCATRPAPMDPSPCEAHAVRLFRVSMTASLSAIGRTIGPLVEGPNDQGRVVMLIDERAGSEAEDTALFFESATDVLFVGSPTSGMDGMITHVVLPGGLSLQASTSVIRMGAAPESWTGLEPVTSVSGHRTIASRCPGSEGETKPRSAFSSALRHLRIDRLPHRSLDEVDPLSSSAAGDERRVGLGQLLPSLPSPF